MSAKLNTWWSQCGEAIKAHAVIMSEYIIFPQFQPHYNGRLRPFRSRVGVVRTRRQRAVVSSDAFQIMTDCWHTRRHSHIITPPQTQTLFLSHMYTNSFYERSPAHTGAHPGRHPVSNCANASGNTEHVSRRVLKEIQFKMIPTSLISKANGRVLFIGERYDRLQLWINSHSMQPRPKERIRRWLKEQRAKGELGGGGAVCEYNYFVIIAEAR